MEVTTHKNGKRIVRIPNPNERPRFSRVAQGFTRSLSFFPGGRREGTDGEALKAPTKLRGYAVMARLAVANAVQLPDISIKIKERTIDLTHPTKFRGRYADFISQSLRNVIVDPAASQPELTMFALAEAAVLNRAGWTEANDGATLIPPEDFYYGPLSRRSNSTDAV